MLIDPKKTLFINSRGPVGAAVKEAPVDGKSYVRKDGGWSEATLSEGDSGFSGDYNDLTNKPNIPSDISDLTDNDNLLGQGGSGDVNVQSDWVESDSTSDAYIKNKPTLFSGNYNDLTSRPVIPTDIGNLTDSNNLLFSGSYNDLSSKPAIPELISDLDIDTANIGNDKVIAWDSTTNKHKYISQSAGGVGITDAPNNGNTYGRKNEAWEQLDLFSGSYNDLTNKPTIPTDLSDLTDNSNLLFSGSYTDLTNKPTIPTDVKDITDSTNLLFSGSYNDLSDKPSLFDGSYDSLSNKPNIPAELWDLDVDATDRANGRMLVWDSSSNTHKYIDVPSGGGSAMSLSTSKATIVASATNTAAGSTNGLIDVKAKYGGIITMKITNGATAPTLPCRVHVFISHEDTLPAAEDSSWKSIWGFSGTTVANESITQAFTFGPEIRNIKVLFIGNTAQDVTVEALASLYEIS